MYSVASTLYRQLIGIRFIRMVSEHGIEFLDNPWSFGVVAPVIGLVRLHWGVRRRRGTDPGNVNGVLRRGIFL